MLLIMTDDVNWMNRAYVMLIGVLSDEIGGDGLRCDRRIEHHQQIVRVRSEEVVSHEGSFFLLFRVRRPANAGRRGQRRHRTGDQHQHLPVDQKSPIQRQILELFGCRVLAYSGRPAVHATRLLLPASNSLSMGKPVGLSMNQSSIAKKMIAWDWMMDRSDL